eukprot:sb/3469917/
MLCLPLPELLQQHFLDNNKSPTDHSSPVRSSPRLQRTPGKISSFFRSNGLLSAEKNSSVTASPLRQSPRVSKLTATPTPLDLTSPNSPRKRPKRKERAAPPTSGDVDEEPGPSSAYREMCDTTPKRGDTTPKRGDTTPKQGDTTPKRGDITPKQGDITPKSGDTTSTRGDTTPKRGDTTPKRGDTTPKRGDTTPKQGDTTPKRGVIYSSYRLRNISC